MVDLTTTTAPLGDVVEGEVVERDRHEIIDGATTSQAPNMRFGASFLDFVKHHKLRAVKDEVLMDKRTGQLVYKRKTDGKFIYWSQENVHLAEYMRELKALMQEKRKTYLRPQASNCDYCENVYFLSYNIEMVDFVFEESLPQSLAEGGILLNNSPDDHSFCQETNGFFFQLNGRPRDRALISFLTSLYDDYYRVYDGEDPDALSRKEMYSFPNYDKSNAVVNYTVSYYDDRDALVASDTTDGYIRVNEFSLIPFVYTGLYPRSRVAYAKIRINSISMPKIAKALEMVTEGSLEETLVKGIKDNDDFAFISGNVSIFICISDKNFNTPTETNCVPLLIMSWDEFEEELIRAKTGGSGGVVISVMEPDPIDWEDITIWAEILRDVNADGSEEETDHKTDVDKIEEGFKKQSFQYGEFTFNQDEPENYYVNRGEDTDINK